MKKNAATSPLISAPTDSAVISSWSTKPPPTLPATTGPRGRAPAMPHQPAWFNDGPYAIMGELPFLNCPNPASLLPTLRAGCSAEYFTAGVAAYWCERVSCILCVVRARGVLTRMLTRIVWLFEQRFSLPSLSPSPTARARPRLPACRASTS
jgi:hypothetical protein